ncbi:SRPBCC domain-containing protein [Kitasatospora sp. NPDC059571]|uniref:SRPBCC domain-containing protein n=1 Tax=Kitasatospora sp. NPDC059571 TaxID=3346871 RepID=UPI0036A87D55
MDQDRIELEITVAAPVTRVWELLTHPSGIGRWLGTGRPAEIDLRPGGPLRCHHGTGPHGLLTARFARIEPPRRLAFRRIHTGSGGEPAAGRQTLVEFILAPESAAGTRLRLAESGFAALAADGAAHRARNAAAWAHRLAVLRDHAERPAAPMH